MANSNPLIVRFDAPLGMTFGVAMNNIRTWLDSNKIQPLNFRPTVGPGIAFELSFRAEHEARRFRKQFVC